MKQIEAVGESGKVFGNRAQESAKGRLQLHHPIG